MAWIKLKTDCFINPKVRRLSDGAFRLWVYLLAQAWEESPGKPAGVVRVKGLAAKDEGGAHDGAARILGGAAGANEGDIYGDASDFDLHPGYLNECENVGLIHIAAEQVGTTVGTDGTAVWDIELAMHDWSHHNPRQPPSHTPEGETERKRKYRAGLKNGHASGHKSNGVGTVPSVPTLDKDQDGDKDQDSDRQPMDGGLSEIASTLGTQFGFTQPLGLGKDAARTRREFARWLLAVGPKATTMECYRIATEKGERPRHLSWFVGWLETVPDSRLRRSVQ